MRSDGEQRQRLAGEVAYSREHLTTRLPSLGIDRRPDQDERPGAVRPPNRELGHDLAAERVRNEGGALQPESVETRGERPGKAVDPERLGRSLTTAVSRQIRDEDGVPIAERPREREHVRARDAEAVDEHDRLAGARLRHVHAESVDVDRPARDSEIAHHPESRDLSRSSGSGDARAVSAAQATRMWLWFGLGGFLLYAVLLLTLGIRAGKRGHPVFFIVGFIFPILWIIGAFLPDVSPQPSDY